MADTYSAQTEKNSSHNTPFHDLDQYLALPRVGGLALSPDGTRLVTGIAVLNEAGTKYKTSLWELDPAGEADPRQLTRSVASESAPTFTPDGDLLFISARKDPDRPDAEAGAGDLWMLPAGGGEARVIARRPGGIDSACTPSGPNAANTKTIVIASETLPSATDVDSEAELRAARKKSTVNAILHDSYPIRYWDHDLGPEAIRLLSGELDGSKPGTLFGQDRKTAETKDESAESTPWDGGELALRDLTPTPGRALDEGSFDITPDGRHIISTWRVPIATGGQHPILVAIEVTNGARTVLWDDPSIEIEGVVISPDGSRVAVTYSSIPTAELATASRCVILELPAPDEMSTAVVAKPRELAPDWDHCPSGVAWMPSGDALIVAADHDGRSPIFRIDLAIGGEGTDVVTRITSDDGAYTNLAVAPDGSAVYAVRSSYLDAPAPVRVPLDGSGYVSLRLPYADHAVPGTVVDVATTAPDGARVRSWLILPDGASPDSPSPLLLWPHGGPIGSWNAWSWRWNPWLLAAKGYAVLLPDPSLSTGYGQEFIQRGWGTWGSIVYEDLMAATDAVIARPDIDETRIATMGGSFGGYMVNWIAGHTDRFKAIVSHASLWAMDQFMPTTDGADYWRHELTEQMVKENSPHLHVGNIRTPMLVIHGDMDYRVPISEGLRLWYELLSTSQLAVDADGKTAHRFLYYPDENHWVLSPQNAKVWYQVVYAFLAEHVLGTTEELPKVLG